MEFPREYRIRFVGLGKARGANQPRRRSNCQALQNVFTNALLNILGGAQYKPFFGNCGGGKGAIGAMAPFLSIRRA
jgi:hypothetical protein